MKTVFYSPLAQRDINDIWDYTFTQWGETQAVNYTRILSRASRELSSGLVTGRPADIRDGYFKYPAGQHVLFYIETDEAVTVIRILHKSMDVSLHL